MRKKFSDYRLKFGFWLILVLLTMTLSFTACSVMLKPAPQVNTKSSPETTELNIWWEQGLNFDEDEALRLIVNNWQKQTGNQVKLSFFNDSELTAKAERALQAGNPPDLMMNPKAERTLIPRWAWQGQLEDVSAVLEPMKDAYGENILRGITYHNAVEDKQSYYAVPLYQSTLFIYYWQKLLASYQFT